MPYARNIDRSNPALIVILVDQSESMTESINRTRTTKSEAVASQINTLIHELIIRSTKTGREGPRPYFYVSVIGYSTDHIGEPVVESALNSSFEEDVTSTTHLAAHPLRIASRLSPTGGVINSVVWVEPVGRGGTPMCTALDRAGRLATSWVNRYPHAFPPVIINLSDGEATDGDPTVWAERIRRLGTSDGRALLFNLSISADPVPAELFPSDAGNLRTDYALRLFRMSSPLPDSMIAKARGLGIAVRPGARGFVFNADIKSVAQFLNVGTSIGRVVL